MFNRGTIAEFNSLHASMKASEGITAEGKIGTRLGVPSPNTQRTYNYSEAIPHPVNDDDYIWGYGAYIDNTLPVLTYEEAATEGWFSYTI